MFSVDNFYEIFQSYYGWYKTQNILWVFNPHGSKNLVDAKAYVTSKNLADQNSGFDVINLMNKNIIMHDQEPFFKDYCIDIYRKSMMEAYKSEIAWKYLTPEELFLTRWPGRSWPIFCHSEVNNIDIDWLQSIGVINCYYFWNGLIARDWFRHWRHHCDLYQKKQWQQRFLLYMRDYTGTRGYRSQIKTHLIELRNQIFCNWDNDHSICSDHSAKIVVEDAVNTAIHLVSETVFERDRIYVTEKSLRPMVMRQPFIIFSGAGTLKYLKSYGFRSFGEIWDESYDQEIDSNLRFDKLIGLINQLYQLPEKEFQSIIDRCEEIVDHNHRWFFSDEFEQILLNEMHNNVRRALEEQQYREKEDPIGSFFYAINSIKNKGILIDPQHSRLFGDWLQEMLLKIKKSDLSFYQAIIKKYPWAKEF